MSIYKATTEVEVFRVFCFVVVFVVVFPGKAVLNEQTKHFSIRVKTDHLKFVFSLALCHADSERDLSMLLLLREI